RQICAQAGVSPGRLAQHFSGIDDLIARTYEHVGDEVSAVLAAALAAAPDEPEAKLRAFVDASFRPPLLDPDLLAVWLPFWSLVRRDPRLHGLHPAIYPGHPPLLDPPSGGVAPGGRADVRLATLAFTAMLDGLWLELCLDPTAFTPAEALAIAHAWVDGLKAGALTMPETPGR